MKKQEVLEKLFNASYCNNPYCPNCEPRLRNCCVKKLNSTYFEEPTAESSTDGTIHDTNNDAPPPKHALRQYIDPANQVEQQAAAGSGKKRKR